MAVDLDWARRHESDLRQRLGVAVAAVREQCPDLYTLDRTGHLQMTPTGAPSRSDKVLFARLRSLTAVHNFVVEGRDGRTAAERFFGGKPEPVFEWLLERMPELPRPAQKRSSASQKATAAA